MLSLLLLMSVLLGVTSYSTAMLPFTFSSSKNTLDQFSLLGAGLLVGTALGVILPEGVETIIRTRPDDKQNISPAIALPLLLGFAFMLLMDQLVSPHVRMGHDARSTGLPIQNMPRSGQADATVDFDAELNELEQQDVGGTENHRHTQTPVRARSEVAPAGMSITFGLVVHALVDGMALGVSSLTDTMSSSLAVVVFLALVVHKAPTSLALSSSLLATGMPRDECKKHIVIFASATPAGALASFFFLSLLGSDKASWTGIALLVSGGTFLYVATVLQSALYHATSTEITRMGRISCIAAGILLPFVLSAILGHNH
ncbi:hypothetical protein AX15_001031 [Amanita polypyramis BW_CC]|nr:hypothetical protein AX15_001031 [Amanita polypyramis BW_CC]